MEAVLCVEPRFPSAYGLRGSRSLRFSCSFPSLKHGDETLKSSPFQYETIFTKEVRTVGCRQQKRNEKVLTVQIHTENIVIYTQYIYIVFKDVSSCPSQNACDNGTNNIPKTPGLSNELSDPTCFSHQFALRKPANLELERLWYLIATLLGCPKKIQEVSKRLVSGLQPQYTPFIYK